MNTIDELERLKTRFAELPYGDSANKTRLLMELETVTRQALDDDAERFMFEVRRVTFHSLYSSASAAKQQAWVDGRTAMVAVIEGIEHAVKMTSESIVANPNVMNVIPSNRVFIVHGHDKAMLAAIEAYTRRLGLEPIVLSEEANRGRTLIEKFEEHGTVDYAVVLLSPDDVGRAAKDPPEKERPRPRQNAVLELGYFIGSLGRQCVAAVVDATKPNTENPSDVDGVAYIPFDASHNEWKLLLAREYRAAGLPIDDSKA